MTKIVGIIKDDAITGVEYGLIEIFKQETQVQRATDAYKKVQSIRNKRTANIHKNNTKKK